MRNYLMLAMLLAGSAHAQGAASPPAAAPDSLTIYFNTGSAALTPDGIATLDHASRIYRQGNPIVMQVSGGTDNVGDGDANLRLSEARARAVLQGLIARGIPAERFQLVAKGETEPAISAPRDTPEAKNRRVDITWR